MASNYASDETPRFDRLDRLDISYSVETPEGTDLQVDLAGPVPRCLAYSIDLAIRTGIIIVLSLVLLFAGNTGYGLLLVAMFLLEWFYPVLFEVCRRGQTPGKKLLGLVVINDDLTAISWGTSLIRNLLRAVDFLPFSYIGGLTCMVLTRRFQRLGDIAAGSLVIHQHAQPKAAPPTPCKPLTPNLSLSIEDQIAIVNFYQRQRQLSKDRQRELAQILTPVMAVSPMLMEQPAPTSAVTPAPTIADKQAASAQEADAGIERLHRIGAWLLGD